MHGYVHSASNAVARDRTARMVVAGVGHHGLAVAAEALDAGFRVTYIRPATWRFQRLVAGLAVDDDLAAALQAGCRTGTLEFSTEPRCESTVDVAVFTPAEAAGAPAEPDPVELTAAALAPDLRPRSLVVIVGRGGLQRCADVVTGTIGMLTGREAGPGYLLGFAVPPAHDGVVTAVSGVDAASVSRTVELFGRLGRPTTTVIPPAAAQLVAHLQDALLRKDRPCLSNSEDLGTGPRRG